MPYADPAKRQANHKNWYRKNAERAKARSREWYANNKAASRARNREWIAANPDRVLEYSARWRRGNPAKRLWYAARARAKDKGIEFDIVVEDVVIPKLCPVLGLPLKWTGKQSDNSASLDRIDNSKGYIKGNVVVVSRRANGLKSDASLEELAKLASFYSAFLK
jgi:hypothetical protein